VQFVHRADGLRVLKEKLSPVVALGGDEGAGGSIRTEYLYDGQMPVCEQEYEDGVLQQTRVNFLGARGIEAVVAIDHTRGNQVSLQWLLYDGHGNLVRTLSPDYTLSAFQWRGVWGEVQGSLGTGRGYCANLGHPEDETGLVYMRARYYEPATGRFISEDPARDGMNWYLYADGNPVNRVDTEGRSPSPDLKELMKLGSKWRLGAVIAFILTKMINFHGLDHSAGKLIQHVLEGIEALVGAIVGFRNMLKVYEAFRQTRGDVAMTGVRAIAIEGALASLATVYAITQLTLAYYIIADPSEHDWMESQPFYGWGASH